MKKTKIICTMGPNTDNREMLTRLALHGMDVARFNFSHGDYTEQKNRLDLLKSVRDELGLPVAALLDTRGPEIRTGLLKDGKKVMLKDGMPYILTTREVEGGEQICQVNYEGLPACVHPGTHILIDDGLIDLEIEKIEDTELYCRVVSGGELGQRKGVNVPKTKIDLPGLTEKDRNDIRFGIEQGFDFNAASFVRNADVIREIRQMLKEADSRIKIIAKIENEEGIENLDEIIRESDGIMVARGDLGVEIPPQKLPYIQKTVICKCNITCKTVIVATQMLDSMIRNPRPTRAEVTDVANAVYEGADAVMLSGETAMGKYPVEALKIMAQICRDTEEHLDECFYKKRRISQENLCSVSNAVCYSSVSTAHDLHAKVIVAPSMSGFTAWMLSKWRPQTPIIGLSPDAQVVRQMQLFWGVLPFQAKRAESTDILIYSSLELLAQKGIVAEGDLIVATAGIVHDLNKTEASQHTNIMRVVEITESC